MVLRKYFDPDKTSFAIVVLIFLTLLFTYPTIFQLSTHLIGGTADGWQFPWNNYIFRERLLHGQDPYFTDQVFYPVGVSLILHGYTEFNNVIGLALHPFFNDVAVTNLMVLLATFLSGLGVYLLTKELTGNSIAALFAAIAFAFCPFRLIRIIGHIHMALTQFLPLAIWAMIKMGKTQKLRYAIWSGVFFALACYCNYYFVIYLIIVFLLMIIYGMIRYPSWRSVLFFRNLVLSGVAAVILLLPVAYHTYAVLKSGQAASFSAEEAFYAKKAAHLWDYFRIAPLNQAILKSLGESPVIFPYSRVTSGWIVLLFFVPGLFFTLVKRPSYFGVLLFTGFVFFLLSLGPSIDINENYKFPLPYGLISGIPILSHVRIPDRFAIMVNLVMAVVAGYGLVYLSGKISEGARKFLYLGAFSLLLIELAPFPFPMESFDPPKVFNELAKSEGKAMLSLPFYPGNIRAKLYMRFQSVHKQKLLDGRVSRNPWLPIQYVKDLPIAKTFRSITNGVRLRQDTIETDRVIAPFFRDFFQLRTIAVYPPFSYRPEDSRYIQTLFPDAKLLSDEKGILVYSLPETGISEFRCTKEDDAIRFFLLENWQIDRRIYQIVCRGYQTKLLLPAFDADQMTVKLFMRTKKNRDNQPKLKFKIGENQIAEGSLTQQFHPVRVEIPGQILKNDGRILQIDIEKKYPETTVELHAIEVTSIRR
jgi:hypothetical protein